MATIRYYRENETGDYMQVDHSRGARNNDGTLTARAAAIAGNPSSVCTTSVQRAYLKEKCSLVHRSAVPSRWLEQLFRP